MSHGVDVLRRQADRDLSKPRKGQKKESYSRRSSLRPHRTCKEQAEKDEYAGEDEGSVHNVVQRRAEIIPLDGLTGRYPEIADFVVD